MRFSITSLTITSCLLVSASAGRNLRKGAKVPSEPSGPFTGDDYSFCSINDAPVHSSYVALDDVTDYISPVAAYENVTLDELDQLCLDTRRRGLFENDVERILAGPCRGGNDPCTEEDECTGSCAGCAWCGHIYEGRDISCTGLRPNPDYVEGGDEDEFEEYSGYYICHSPRVDHSFPRTHCQPNDEYPPDYEEKNKGFAYCGWCCQTDADVEQDNQWDADECGDADAVDCDSDDDEVLDGFVMCVGNGSNQKKGWKAKTECVHADEVQEKLNQFWGSSCGAC